MATDLSHLENLIAKCALGDQKAFSALYDATSAKLLGVCIRVLSERAEAEDAMQEAFVKVWNNANRYQVTGHSPMTWLITIARNTAIDRLRAKKGHDDLSTVEERIAAPGRSPEQSAIAASEAQRIMGCLDELEGDKREAVIGAYLDGQRYKDLAARFDVPLNTMRTWLRRGLTSLQECMAR
ncbi:MAG: sigma-70 family RNA polymerase sigma factor [Pseudomonadota bacterium]